MCNLLRRNGKPYQIFAGHMEHSDVLDRVADAARAAAAAKELRKARVGVLGTAFAGMGDFQVPFAELKRDLGIVTVPYDFSRAAEWIEKTTPDELDGEYRADSELCEVDPALTREVYDRSARVCLAVRRWVEEEKLSAFTINFLETEGSRPGLPIMPFTECCRAMAHGVGYAGEGDVLTAALVGALLTVYPETTFTEMFCPDWAHGSVFLSHMGEYNYRVADGKPLLQEKPFPFTSAENPIAAYKTMKGGRATFLNLAPFGRGRYGLTMAGGEMLKITGKNNMAAAVNGWFRPDVPLERFLEGLSCAGATHHSALVYGVTPEQLAPLADFLGCERHIVS